MESQSELTYVIDAGAVRRRPAMYIGGVDYFGHIHYLVCPFAMLLNRQAKRIDVEVLPDGFEVSGDVVIEMPEHSEGCITPFERLTERDHYRDFEGLILNALSERLEVITGAGDQMQRLAYCRGERVARECVANAQKGPATTFRFCPDYSILTPISLSLELFHSFLRRMSYLHSGVRFTVTAEGATHVYYQERGLLELFRSVAAPYQILHEPIEIQVTEGELTVGAVFAYQSWLDNDVWCFINRGRAVRGGTHEKGFMDALKRLPLKLEMRCPEDTVAPNGIVGVLSVVYPKAVWEGCVKGYIGNPELRTAVRRIVIRETIAWVKARPDLAEQLRHLRPFTFPEIWSR